MAEAELPVLGWQINYAGLQGMPRSVTCGHNCVGDYRDIDPCATSIEVTSRPAALAAVAQLQADLEFAEHKLAEERGDFESVRFRAAELQAECERLRSDRDCEKRLRKDAEEAREVATEECERLRKDAGRYQLWRNSYAESDNTEETNPMLLELANCWTPAAVDACIDKHTPGPTQDEAGREARRLSKTAGDGKA